MQYHVWEVQCSYTARVTLGGQKFMQASEGCILNVDSCHPSLFRKCANPELATNHTLVLQNHKSHQMFSHHQKHLPSRNRSTPISISHSVIGWLLLPITITTSLSSNKMWSNTLQTKEMVHC